MSQTEGGGRYERSASGLIIAMVVTVAAVIVLVVIRDLISSDLEVEPEAVDYLEKVEQAQDAGLEPAYPPTLPEGWQATGAEVTPGQLPGFGLSLLTDDEKYVGVRQEADSVDDLLEEYVGEATDEGGPFAVTGSVATTWATYSDTGGDLAYAAEVGETTVLVYGSADRSDIEQVVGSLTTRPLRSPSPSP
ncbi:MAG: DUF4245 domain-containing protein [Actinomycetota bacterium]|nr:DUF4245 domain-containing protein [Actinomycetota bacterium]